MELVTTTRKEEEDRQAQLAEAMQKTPRTADPGGYRHKELNKRINHMDCKIVLLHNEPIILPHIRNQFSILFQLWCLLRRDIASIGPKQQWNSPS